MNQVRINRTLARENEVLPQTLIARISELSCCLLCCEGGEDHRFTLTPGWDVIVLRYGIPSEILRKPDLYYFNNVTLKWVDVQKFFKTMNNLQVNDSQGFPLKVDITFGYQVVDVIAATYICTHSDYTHFLHEQARSTLIQVAAQFPYDSDDRKRDVLRVHNFNIEDRLKTLLQEFVKVIGVRINYFQIQQIQYDEAFQHFFLERQRAQAFVTARRAILDASFGVVEKAIEGVEKQGRPLTQAQKAELAIRLIFINCTPAMDLKLVQGSELPAYLVPFEEEEEKIQTQNKES